MAGVGESSFDSWVSHSLGVSYQSESSSPTSEIDYPNVSIVQMEGNGDATNIARLPALAGGQRNSKLVASQFTYNLELVALPIKAVVRPH